MELVSSALSVQKCLRPWFLTGRGCCHIAHVREMLQRGVDVQPTSFNAFVVVQLGSGIITMLALVALKWLLLGKVVVLVEVHDGRRGLCC